MVQDTLEATFGLDFLRGLIGEKAYDSDGLDKDLSDPGV